MYLSEIKLQNYRRYRDEIRISLDELTVFVGRNDSGKSSILEALSLFFGDSKASNADLTVGSTRKSFEITCVFSNVTNGIILDTTNHTTLREEYLLRADGLLEIKKVFTPTSTNPHIDTFLRCTHPTSENTSDLLSLTNDELKARCDQLGFDRRNIDSNKNAPLRNLIRERTEDLALQEVNIPIATTREISNKDIAKIGAKLLGALPTFALFKSDRESSDQDDEAQDPLKAAVKEALDASKDQIDILVAQVRERAIRIADLTVSKLKEMDPSLASQLTPKIALKSLTNSFSIELTGEGQVPINRRGSGVRRLILLNFFRAKAEKSQDETDSSIIYAIEEPETSQHPSNQKLLYRTLKELSARHNIQVIITTHTPMLARLVDTTQVRYVPYEATPVQIVECSPIELNDICRDLGVLPDNNVKLFIGVEGPNDIEWLKGMNKVARLVDPTLIDLDAADINGEVLFIPTGGSTLQTWIDRLNHLNRREFYLIDKDIEPKTTQNTALCARLNAPPSRIAFVTNKREAENYVSIAAINGEIASRYSGYTYPGTFTSDDDVPVLLAEALHMHTTPTVPWATLTDKDRQSKESKVKKLLTSATSRMTPACLTSVDPANEIIGWFRSMTTLVQTEV